VTVVEEAVDNREPSVMADVHANVLESTAVEHIPVGYVQIACVFFQVNLIHL